MLGEESRHREGREETREESVYSEVLEGKRDHYFLYFMMFFLDCLAVKHLVEMVFKCHTKNRR